MGSDMVAALPRATSDACAVFGHNSWRPVAEVQTLVSKPGRTFATGEMLRLRRVQVPQVRQTCRVLAGRPAGLWGYSHGVNEHGVAIGLTHIRTRLRSAAPGLDGYELTRLALERSSGARAAIDVLTDLIGRHGQGTGEGEADNELDSAFLVLDRDEAFVLQAAGDHWAEQEVKEVRAVSSMCHLRQDWDRISRGLAELVIARSWWPEDGTKVDFAEAVGRPSGDETAALRRWGRATLHLEERNGRIDLPFVRRLLAAIPEEPSINIDRLGAVASMVTEAVSSTEAVPISWVSLVPPGMGVFFPVCLAGDLPQTFSELGQGGLWRRLRRMQTRGGELKVGARAMLDELQVHFDHFAADFKAEAAELTERGECAARQTLASSFMEHVVERFEEASDSLATSAAGVTIEG